MFFAFDLLHHDGEDLRGKPLVERRAIDRAYGRPVQSIDASITEDGALSATTPSATKG